MRGPLRRPRLGERRRGQDVPTVLGADDLGGAGEWVMMVVAKPAVCLLPGYAPDSPGCYGYSPAYCPGITVTRLLTHHVGQARLRPERVEKAFHVSERLGLRRHVQMLDSTLPPRRSR